MWTLKTLESGETILTYDKTRYRTNQERGTWAYIGLQSSPMINEIIRINEANGLVCCNDDEGSVRVLVLQD